MRFFRRPAVWATIVAAAFAFTIGGQPFNPLPNDGGDDGVIEIAISLDVAEAVAAGGPDDRLAAGASDGVLSRGDSPEASSLDSSNSASRSGPAQLHGGLPANVGGPTEEEAAEVEARIERPRVIVHTVQRGETISQIAARYGIDENTILAANDLPNANAIQVGQKLNILTIPGALHTVKRGESLWEIARTYQTDMAEIIAVNGIENPSRIQASQELIIPGAKAASIGSAIRSEQLVSADGRLLRAFSWPVSGRLSSRYGPRWGRMHHGIDVAVNTGTPVRAAARGRVSFAGWNGGYGYLVIIDHGNNIETRYAHLSRISVKVGQYVERGTVIAYSGNTGNSTGPHLHFEIRQKGQSVNPLNYLR